MRRFLSGVLALFICFTSIVPAFAVEDKPDIKTTLDPGQEWFCEKHFVPKGTAPDGMQQFCAFCQSDASLFAANPDGDSDITAVYCGDAVQNPSLIPCPTFAGENGLVIYGLPDFYVSPTVGLTTVMLCFRYKAPWQPKDLYDGASLTFYYGTNVANMGGWQGLNKYQFASSPNWAAADPVDLPEDASFCTVTTSSVSDFNSKYIAYWASVHSFGPNMNTTFSSSSDGRYLWLRLNIENDVQANIAQLYFTKPYTDPSGQTTLKPGDPGFDTVGGIFEMIKKILESIVNLPSKIAEAVKGFFTALGNQISGAIDSMFEGIKGLWNDSSHHNNEVDNAISGLEQQDQQLGTVEDQILGDFSSQGSQLDTVMDGLTFPVGMSSAMTWITLQVNSMWTGLGADIRLVFTFSFVLGLALIFLGRWRA